VLSLAQIAFEQMLLQLVLNKQTCQVVRCSPTPLLLAPHSEAEKLEAAEEEGRNNDVWSGMEVNDPELQSALVKAGGLAGP
jgi:hypothetical protein